MLLLSGCLFAVLRNWKEGVLDGWNWIEGKETDGLRLGTRGDARRRL